MSTSSTPELRELTSEESHAFVISIAKEMHALLDSRLCEIVSKQRFLIAGRVINVLFSRFYSINMRSAEEAVQAAAKENS